MKCQTECSRRLFCWLADTFSVSKHPGTDLSAPYLASEKFPGQHFSLVSDEPGLPWDIAEDGMVVTSKEACLAQKLNLQSTEGLFFGIGAKTLQPPDGKTGDLQLYHICSTVRSLQLCCSFKQTLGVEDRNCKRFGGGRYISTIKICSIRILDWPSAITQKGSARRVWRLGSRATFWTVWNHECETKQGWSPKSENKILKNWRSAEQILTATQSPPISKTVSFGKS